MCGRVEIGVLVSVNDSPGILLKIKYLYFASQWTFHPHLIHVSREVYEVLAGGVDETVLVWC